MSEESSEISFGPFNENSDEDENVNENSDDDAQVEHSSTSSLTDLD